METPVGSADEPAASSVRAASAGRYRPPRYAKRMHSCATPRSFPARNRRAALADRTLSGAEMDRIPASEETVRFGGKAAGGWWIKKRPSPGRGGP